ncbi:alpha/beta fold hydrolase [Nocardia sp. KC 131]|uniref:alpha/beta fold hydrolase n=1 Tax=Nocardia arseniciresistens TaxID=3392119 RepID=UPI00398EABE4
MSDSIVFGAAGFIGRAVVARLLKQQRAVTAAVRPGTGKRLTSWLDESAIDRHGLEVVECDITAKNLGLPEELDSFGIQDVYNCAARFAFGLDHDSAYAVNVTGALNVLDWATACPKLRRVVHITGYRIGVDEQDENYRANGAYGASKVESDALLRQHAAGRHIPLTIANPSSVIGPGQYLGLAPTVEDLWNGKLAAIPGGSKTFVPIVDLDYFAEFLTSLPAQDGTAGQSITVLDQRTPVLPDLIRLLATHMNVRAPKFSIPVGVIEKLPRALTGADRESLRFLAEDRYDTSAANEVARIADITMPPTESTLRRWTDHLVSSRFGTVAADPSAGFVDGMWVSGDRKSPSYLFLHGLPLNSDSWDEVRGLLGAPSLAVDLPGLGRSAPGEIDALLPQLMSSVDTRPVLVGNSLGCGPVLRYAAAHLHRISGVVLISPPFLQQRAGLLKRSPLATVALHRLSANALAAQLGVPEGSSISSAATDLRRGRVANRTIEALRRASSLERRAELRELLEQTEVPVRIIVGSDDPLTFETFHKQTVIDGAGHFPQLTHASQVAAELTASHE